MPLLLYVKAVAENGAQLYSVRTSMGILMHNSAAFQEILRIKWSISVLSRIANSQLSVG